MSFVSKWMGDYDNKKAKEEDIAREDKLREQAQAQRDLEHIRGRNESLEDSQRDIANRKSFIADEDLKKLKQTTLNSTWMANNVPKGREALSNPSTWELFPEIARSLAASDLARNQNVQDFNSTRGIIAPRFVGTDEQGALIYPSLEGSNAAKTEQGLTDIVGNVAQSNTNTQLKENQLKDATVQRGGRLPYLFSGDELQTIYNPKTGGYTVNINPDALKLGTGGMPASLERMIAGNNSLAGIAMSNGLMDSGAITRNSTEYDKMGNRTKTNIPPKATPNRTPVSLFTGNLNPVEEGNESFGRASLADSLGFSGMKITPAGTIEAQPIDVNTAFGRKALINGEREPTPQEAEVLKQRAMRLIQIYKKNGWQ